MSLMTIEQFEEFADANPELADTVRTTYDENGINYYDSEWNSFVDSMIDHTMTFGGSVAPCMSTMV